MNYGNLIPQESLYREEYCTTVIELGKLGKSVNQMATHIGVCKDTIYEWRKKFPEFKIALAKAVEEAMSWWENLGQTHILYEKDGKRIETALYNRIMCARFRKEYGDKVAITGGDEDDAPIKAAVEVTGKVALYVPDNGRRPDLNKSADVAE